MRMPRFGPCLAALALGLAALALIPAAPPPPATHATLPVSMDDPGSGGGPPYSLPCKSPEIRIEYGVPFANSSHPLILIGVHSEIFNVDTQESRPQVDYVRFDPRSGAPDPESQTVNYHPILQNFTGISLGSRFIAVDDQPHRISLSDGQCAIVKFGKNASGCPLVRIVIVPCAPCVELGWGLGPSHITSPCTLPINLDMLWHWSDVDRNEVLDHKQVVYNFETSGRLTESPGPERFLAGVTINGVYSGLEALSGTIPVGNNCCAKYFIDGAGGPPCLFVHIYALEPCGP
jgi:hypothetical protein